MPCGQRTGTAIVPVTAPASAVETATPHRDNFQETATSPKSKKARENRAKSASRRTVARKGHSTSFQPFSTTGYEAIWQHIVRQPFKPGTPFDLRPLAEQHLLDVMAGNLLYRFTRSMEWDMKPGQTPEGFLDYLRELGYRTQGQRQAIPFLAVFSTQSEVRDRLPHLHVLMALPEGSPAMRAVEKMIKYRNGRAGLHGSPYKPGKGIDKSLPAEGQPQRRPAHITAISDNVGRRHRPGDDARLMGLAGKASYLVHHFADLKRRSLDCQGDPHEVTIHASRDIRARARQMAEHGFDAETMVETIAETMVEPMIETMVETIAETMADQVAETIPAATPIMIEAPAPAADLGPVVADAEAWRRHTDWARLFDQEAGSLVGAVRKVTAAGRSKPLAVREVLDRWFRHHGYEAGASLPFS